MNPSPPDSAITVWLKRRADHWHRLRDLAESQRDRRDESLDLVCELAHGFRSLARDVSLSREALPDSRISRQLEALFQRLHEAIYRTPGDLRYEIIRLFKEDVPDVIRRLRGNIVATTAIFLMGGVAGWLLVSRHPELAALFASEEMINRVQRGELWTEGLVNVFPSSILSLAIMTNNIVVSLFAFALGAFYGLGTLYIMGLNGLMLGGVFAFTAAYGLDGELFKFVLAHGVVELSVICLAGAAGAQLGEALARPGSRSRSEAFREAVMMTGKLLPVCALFLIGAGFIEGYISPDPTYPLASRAVVGLAYGALLWSVLSGRLWRLAGPTRS